MKNDLCIAYILVLTTFAHWTASSLSYNVFPSVIMKLSCLVDGLPTSWILSPFFCYESEAFLSKFHFDSKIGHIYRISLRFPFFITFRLCLQPLNTIQYLEMRKSIIMQIIDKLPPFSDFSFARSSVVSFYFFINKFLLTYLMH